MPILRSVLRLGLGAIVGAALMAHADPAAEPHSAPRPLEEITVMGTTPLSGTGVDSDKLPVNVQSVTADEVTRSGDANLRSAINARLGSVSINDDLDDPFQPDILFRGFDASPVLGTPQGLAVYQNGVRINEAFGDTVNWDLFPDLAIERIDVVGSNPVYGLNALGGAVVLTMKTGFDYQGAALEVSGGSWAQRQGWLEAGGNDGRWGWYGAARLLKQDGWRDFSPDSLKQFYSDLSYRDPRFSLDLSVTLADNALSGESPAPVQELAVDRSLVFTSPQSNENRLIFATVNGSYALSDSWSIQANAYYRAFRQQVINGNTTEYTACTSLALSGSLCQADGSTPLRNDQGLLIPDLSQGGEQYIGENDSESIRTLGSGAALQATSTAPWFGHENHLSAAVSVDADSTEFHSWVEVGTINPQLQVGFSGQFVNTPENTPWTATPVGLHASDRHYGILASDTFNIDAALALTVSGRYNEARVDLTDLLGTALSGSSRYYRFNPAIGASYRMTSSMTGYLGYAEGNRVPTAGEIECSDPERPCLLPSSLSSDPPNLRQVVSRTWELGLRGRLEASAQQPAEISWNAGLFRTDVHDDIYGVATSLSSGYFQNIGGTRREGIELGGRYHGERVSAFFSYSYVAATFQSALLLPSPLNRAADADGNILVHSGDTLPGIPAHRIKAGGDVSLSSRWLVGADVMFASAQYLGGDESNQMPAVPSYVVVNAHASYQWSERVEVYASIVNLLNRDHATFGELGDPTGIGVPGIPVDAETNDPRVDNRFLSPAPPFSVFGGLRVRL